VTTENNAENTWAQHTRREPDRNRRRREEEPVQAVRKPWWQQATALVAVSTGGVITGFNFVPGASATMTSPTSVPVHLLALEQAARTGTDSGAGITANTQLRSAIVNVAGYYLQLARTKTAAQMEALIWDNTSSNGADHGESCAAFASLTLELAAQAVGQQSWVTGGSSYPWPLPSWADVRVDTNPASPAVTSLAADAQAHGRYHPVGGGYQPQPGDWVVFDSHVEVVTSYSGGVLHTIGADSLPGLTVNAHSFSGSLADDGVVAYVDNGNLEAAAGGTAAASGTTAASAPASGTATAGNPEGTTGTSKSAGTGSTGTGSTGTGSTGAGSSSTGGSSTGTGTTGTGGSAAGSATGAAVPGLLAAGDLLGGGSDSVSGTSATGSTSVTGDAGATGSTAVTGGTSGSGSAASVPGLPPSATATAAPTSTASPTSSASADIPGATGTPAAAPAAKSAASPSTGSAGSKKQASSKKAASTKKAPPASSAGRTYATPGTAQQQAFINLVAPGAVAAQQRYGVPAAVTIAQAIEESAWGGSGLAANYHNLFGIKGTGPAGSVSLPTSEYYSGQWVTIDAQFRVYNNDAESIADHAELLATSGYYTRAMADRTVPDAFANDLTGVYATDPDYGANLIALMKLYNLYRFDTTATSSAAPAPAAAATAAPAAKPGAGAGQTAPRTRPAAAGQGRIPGVAAPSLAPSVAPQATRVAAAGGTAGASRAATGRIPGLVSPGTLAPGASTTAAVRYQTPLPAAVTTAFFATAKAPLARGEHLYRDVASCSGVSWKMLAAVDWMECKADPRRSPVHGEKLGSRNADGTSYATKSQALAQCACDLIELAAAVYGIDLTARRQQSVRGLAAAFAAYRWGAILRRQGVSAMEFPYSVAGLTAQHQKMHWPDIDAPDAPDKPGSRFRGSFGAVPVLLSLGYPAIV
jgi:flagellum-specific peptidoglycan hydrolase FlgJ